MSNAHLTPQYKLGLVGNAEPMPGTDGGFTMVVFDGKKVAPGTAVFAYLQQEMECACCGTTENLHDDPGSGGPYRCNSPDCTVY